MIVFVALILLLVSTVAAYLYIGGSQSHTVVVQYIMLHQNYPAGGACFVPNGFIVGNKVQVIVGDNFSEYFTLRDVVTNLKCQLNSIYLMSSDGYPNNAGFTLLSYSPTLPLNNISFGSVVNIALNFHSSRQSFNGWLDVGFNLTSQTV